MSYESNIKTFDGGTVKIVYGAVRMTDGPEDVYTGLRANRSILHCHMTCTTGGCLSIKSSTTTIRSITVASCTSGDSINFIIFGN